MKFIVLIVVAAALSGCGLFDPAPAPIAVTVAPTVELPAYPPECRTADDPRWRDLPAGDADQEDGARNYRQNKGGMREIGGRRRVCEAALSKLYPAP